METMLNIFLQVPINPIHGPLLWRVVFQENSENLHNLIFLKIPFFIKDKSVEIPCTKEP